MVAFGVLEHCQEKRYRVYVGRPHPGTRQKMIAVPYCAADAPSERLKFSHLNARLYSLCSEIITLIDGGGPIYFSEAVAAIA